MAVPNPGAGLLLDIVGQTIVTRIGEETDITMLDKLNLETRRQVSCEFQQRGYTVRPSDFHPWNGDSFADLETNADFYAHMEDAYGYPQEDLFPNGEDTVVLAEYYMVLHDDSIGEYVSELRFDSASIKLTAVSKHAPPNEQLLYARVHYVPRGYSRTPPVRLFEQLVPLETWPQRRRVSLPGCSTKDLFNTLVARELTSDSTIDEMQAFLSSLHIDYQRDHRNRYLHGKFKPEGDLDAVDETIHVVLHFDRSTRTFTRAAVYSPAEWIKYSY